MTVPRALAQAKALADAERWSDVLVVVSAHLASDPDDALALCLSAQAHLGRGAPRAAAQAAERAIELSPNFEWPHRLYSHALTALLDFSGARRAARESVRLAPNLWKTHRQMAEVDVNHGRSYITQQTWSAALRAVELAPDEPWAHLTLGRVALSAKKYRRAEKAFGECLRLDPSMAVARNNLAVAQLSRRRLASATSHFVAAVQLDPTSTLFERNLRMVLRGWATVMNLVGLAGCVAINVVAAPRYRRPPLHSIPVRGHPAGLAIVAGVLVGVFLIAALTLRRHLGRGFGRFVLLETRRDAVLALMVGTGIISVLGVVVAAIAGMPAAGRIASVTVGLVLAGGIAYRVLRRKRRLPAEAYGRQR